MTKIKLCGLSYPEDVAEANRLRPDMIGFVFWENSRRLVTEEQAKVLRELLDPEIPSVGVFVNEDPDHICELAEKRIIQLIQLHGCESESYVRKLKEKCGIPVIKAWKIRSVQDLREAERSPADYILLDNGYGTGEAFDWTLLETINRPFFLAGGLHSDNIREAIERYHPYGVDVSSGIETEGKKDPNKMELFVRAVHDADKR